MASNPTANPAAPGRDLKAAFKEAGFAALVTLGLCIPIIAWGTRQNMDNVLVLDPRWDAVAWAVAIVFVGRFLVALRKQGQQEGKATMRILPHGTIAFFQRYSRIFSVFGLGFLVTFPAIAIGLAGWGGALKWIDNFGVQILIYVMLGWGLNIVVGLAGLLDLGYVAFYAVGAYSYALLAKNFGLSFWLLLPLAGILAAFWGMLLGFPVLRLRGDYLAIVTLAFGEIIRLVLINWTEFSNGYAGISGIPRPTFFGIPFTAADNGFAAVFGLEFSPIYRTIFLYYLILCLALLTAVVTLRLRRLPVGRAWEALREDEIACRSLGINTIKTKLSAFAIGAMFAGFAGSFFATRQGFISPESFNATESFLIRAVVVLGGLGSQLGVVIAVIFLNTVFELRELAEYRMLIVGLSMVLIMVWKPRGLISTRQPSAFLRERKTVSADNVSQGHG
jgi:branched-chain amino acid transport system permease protein